MKSATVTEYIDTFPTEHKKKLSELRKIIKAAIPNAVEGLKWGSPAFTDNDGMILVIIAGYKHHVNLVSTPSTKQAFENELNEYETGKGSVKLPYDKELPTELIKKIVKYRAKEYREHGVKWM